MRKCFIKYIRMMPDGVYIFFIIAFGIIDALAWGYEGIVKNIKFAQVSELYDTLVAFSPDVADNIAKHKYLVLLITLLFAICYGIKKFYKKKLYLIEHFSLGADRGALSDELNEKYNIKEIIVDQTSQLCNGIPSAEVVKLVDSKARELVEKSNKYEIGYLGIAHIPLVFRFGYIINDQSEIHSFHRKRGNREKYKELSHNNEANLFFLPKRKIKPKGVMS